MSGSCRGTFARTQEADRTKSAASSDHLVRESGMNDAMTAAAGRTIDVVAVVDASRISPFTFAMVTLCAGVSFLDGFDILAISYVAPVIAKAWNLPQQAFGPIFAAHYVGAAAGA